MSGPEPSLEVSFEGHADWVNDLALIGDLLITCSNDRTVRLWRAGSENGEEAKLYGTNCHLRDEARWRTVPARMR